MHDRQVPDQYLACRAWGHVWDFTTMERQGGEYVQGFRCMHCPTLRWVRVSTRTGLRRPGGYAYPEDMDSTAVPYKMPKGSGGAITAEERGQATLGYIKGHNDELAARRRRRRRA